MKLKKKAIFRVFEQSRVPLTLTQIRHRLGIRKKQQKIIKEFLYEQVLKKKLLLQNGKYSLPSNLSEAEYEDTHEDFQDDSAESIRAKDRKAKPKGVVGIFSLSSQGFGFVDIGHGLQDIYIPREKQNGARDGDRVEIAIFQSRRSGRKRGRVVHIVERHQKKFIARLRRGKKTTLAMPVNENSSIGPVIIPVEHDIQSAPSGALVEGVLLEEKANSKNLLGKIIRVLPHSSVDELAFDVILAENNIVSHFSQEALQQAEQFSSRVVYSAKSGRRDLRDLGLVTIDGKDARDFDDAVYAEKQESGNFRLWVSIADVAHYVTPGSAIDQEAYQRGTSTYFPTHAIPMLPEALSNSLCSLRPGVNRLTLTCEMEIDASGAVVHSEIYESLIRSCARLNYDDVAAFLENRPSPIRNPDVKANLLVMHELATLLAKKRYQRGAVDFDFPEYRAVSDDNRQILGFQKSYQSVSMKLIEQFMLEANETVARYCVEHNLPSLFRVHEKPGMDKLEKLQETFWYFGVPYKSEKLQNPRNINKLLKKIKTHPSSEQIQLLFLKSMALACYRTTNEGHFGLAAEFYTHFTSPIRRYPDLIVHRAIKAKLNKEKLTTYRKAVTPEVSGYLSQQERRADVAERQSFELVKTIFMERYVGDVLEARVVSVSPAGVTIEFPDLLVEAFLPLENLSDDYYQFDTVRLALFGKHTHRAVQAETQMQVKVLRTDRIERKVELELENWLT